MSVPECFGILWEGLPGSDCEKCKANKDCLADFSKNTLAKAQQELLDDATPEKIGELLDIDPEAIQIAIDFQEASAAEPASEIEAPKPRKRGRPRKPVDDKKKQKKSLSESADGPRSLRGQREKRQMKRRMTKFAWLVVVRADPARAVFVVLVVALAEKQGVIAIGGL